MKLSQRQIAIICITVVLLLFVGGVILTVVGVYTDGFKTKFRHFYVSADKMNYLQDSNVVLGNVCFNIHFVLKRNVGYRVKVVPAGDTYGFWLDGRFVEYTSEVSDVTNAFDIELRKNSFVIHCKDVSLEEVLKVIYPDKDIQLSTYDHDCYVHYRLIVTAGDGSQSIALTFRCLFSVQNVVISPELVI